MQRANRQPSPADVPGKTTGFDPRYLAFFDRFNAGDYFEAHDVLEHLWLETRREPIGDFYKGLIQVAGAFVHVRRGRFQPAIGLLDLAAVRLRPYPNRMAGLDLAGLRRELLRWRGKVFAGDLSPGWLESPDRPRMAPPAS